MGTSGAKQPIYVSTCVLKNEVQGEALEPLLIGLNLFPSELVEEIKVNIFDSLGH